MVEVVITGMGAVTPLGVGVEALWQGLLAGRVATRRLDGLFGLQGPVLGAMVDPLPRAAVVKPHEAKHHDRFTHLALVAVAEALDASGLLGEVPGQEVGVYFGSALGGVESLAEATVAVAGGRSVGPRLVPKVIPNMAAATIAEAWGFTGPNLTFSTACAASQNAIGEAFWAIRQGRLTAAVVGGAESLFAAVIVAGLDSARALSRRFSEPETASRPFSHGRDGMVMGEGAAALVLEDARQAERRGARPLARVVGYGASSDAYHPTHPEPDGRGAELAMRRALASAGLAPSDVDYINAHATSTPAGDEAELKAIRRVFSPVPPISSVKGAIGHCMGAAAAIEAVVVVQALRAGILPPTVNYLGGGPEDLDLVPLARPQAIHLALSNSFGFGGQNACVLFAQA